MNKAYNLQTEKLISSEFRRLNNITYLEHAGATLYSEKQISNTFTDLQENVYANPHAKSTTSKSTEDAIDQIRYQILQHFGTNADEYSVIFTSGATGALKLVAETFNYTSNGGYFTYLEDNHTSVLGMRACAHNTKSISRKLAYKTFAGGTRSEVNLNNSNALFVYPAQCNFSGFKYPLDWIDKVQKGLLNNINGLNCHNWFCMLDAASFVSCNALDLSIYKPDFVCMSFYKIFGYPSGIGALLVKNQSACVLEKQYFGGGTVFMAMSSENIVIRRKKLHERFEDGTMPFLSIMALRHGFDTFNRVNLTMTLISQHTFNLAKYVYEHLSKIYHNNGSKACILYHDNDFENIESQGGIVNFNLLRDNGDHFGYSEVMHMANLYGIQLRTGCFCNPGACQRHLKLSDEDIQYHFQQGHVCGDQNDLIDGCPTGSVRISFGYMSTKRDADNFLEMIIACFVSQPMLRKHADKHNTKQNNKAMTNFATNFCNVNQSQLKEIKGTLEEIYVYPIKSCGSYSVQSGWELVSTGLKFDREWMIVNHLGVCLTQKQETKMCLIKPIILLEANILELTYEGLDNISIPLSSKLYTDNKNEVFLCSSKVCEDQIEGWDCGDNVSDWLCQALNRDGLRLLRQTSNNQGVLRSKENDLQDDMNFSQYVHNTLIVTPKTVLQNGDCDNVSGNYLSSKVGIVPILNMHILALKSIDYYESICEMSAGLISNIIQQIASMQLYKNQLSLVNKSQFLMINKVSAEWLHDCIPKDELNEPVIALIRRFRPNFIVRLPKLFDENSFENFSFGNIAFKSEGPCTRCQMICIDQATGTKSVEPLKTISKEFNGKISFGIYLRQKNYNSSDKIYINMDVIGY